MTQPNTLFIDDDFVIYDFVISDLARDATDKIRSNIERFRRMLSEGNFALSQRDMIKQLAIEEEAKFAVLLRQSASRKRQRSVRISSLTTASDHPLAPLALPKGSLEGTPVIFATAVASPLNGNPSPYLSPTSFPACPSRARGDRPASQSPPPSSPSSPHHCTVRRS